MKLEHVAINVEDAAAAARWWAENLGLRIVSASQQSPYIHFLADEQGSMLEFYTRADVTAPDYAAINPFNLHFAFAVADLAGKRQTLVDAGATIVDEITTTPAGDQLVFLRDPWNVPIQLVKRNKPLA